MITTAKDLRIHTKEILETTIRGEEVIVTYHGKPAARIVPFSSPRKKDRAKPGHTLFGIWKNNKRTRDVDAWVRKARKGRAL